MLISTLSFLATKNNVFASDLTIATDSNFSSQTDNFAAGQTIYVKVNANSDGSEKRQLNVRDNNYNLLQSFTLDYLGGNEFKKTITAPQNEGYYSLEARIEAEGSVSTSVETIKVGEPQNASININVNSKSGGQTTLGNKTTPAPSPSPNPSPSASTLTESTPQVSESTLVDDKKGIFQQIKEFFEKLFKNIWKF